MSPTPRTSPTHFSRIARRLADETGMGYQQALSTVQDQADQIMQQGPRLDGAGRDIALRFLLQQSLEFWGPGIGAHPWPQMYHPVSMTLLYSGLCQEAVQAAQRARDQGQPEPCGSEYDPSYLAAAGVEPLDYDAAPDDDDWEDEPEEPSAALAEAIDEPDRWKRHVLTQGVRPAFRLPTAHLLSTAAREELLGLPADQAATRLEQLVRAQPAAAEAYVLRADLALVDTDKPGAEHERTALGEARRWYECALAVAEVPLHFPMYGGPFDAGPVLLWREESNRPLLQALYGLALIAHRQKRWNTAELIGMSLLYLNPSDEQQAGALLKEARTAAGITQPAEDAPRGPAAAPGKPGA